MVLLHHYLSATVIITHMYSMKKSSPLNNTPS